MQRGTAWAALRRGAEGEVAFHARARQSVQGRRVDRSAAVAAEVTAKVVAGEEEDARFSHRRLAPPALRPRARSTTRAVPQHSARTSGRNAAARPIPAKSAMEPCPNQPTGPPSRCQTLDATVPVDHVGTWPIAQRIWSDDGSDARRRPRAAGGALVGAQGLGTARNLGGRARIILNSQGFLGVDLGQPLDD